MRVLIINTVCGIKSTGRICADLALMLDKLGHEVAIAYGRENVPNEVKKYAHKIGNQFDVLVHAIKARLFDSSGFGSVIATKTFISWIKSFNPDIIHLHNLHGYYLNVELLFVFLKKYNKPVVWTLHDMWAFSGHSAVCDFISCEKWKTECSKCPCLKEYPRSIFDFSKRNFRKKKNAFCGVKNMTIVTPSKWLANLVKDSFLNEYPVQTIYNGVDLTNFYPTENSFIKEQGLKDKYIILAISAVWNARKGFFDYIELSKRMDDSHALVMVGLSKKQMKRLPRNIIGITKTQNIDELRDIYSSANVFLNFTYADVLGMVNLESLACGTPVITYNTGGSPETINDNCGIIIQKGAYISALDYLPRFRDKELYLYQCTERAKLFDVQKKYYEYVNLFLDLYNQTKGD